MLKLYECISVIGTLMKDGVYPNSSRMDGKIFKRYNRALKYLSEKLNIDYDTIADYTNYFILNEHNMDIDKTHEKVKELISKR